LTNCVTKQAISYSNTDYTSWLIMLCALKQSRKMSTKGEIQNNANYDVAMWLWMWSLSVSSNMDTSLLY